MTRRQQVSGIVLTDYELRTAFDSGITLENTLGDGPAFNFVGQIFPRKQILNERLEDGLRFHRRGQVVEGWLLWTGSVPLPPNPRDGAFTACQLTFWDSLEWRIQAEAWLSFFRTTKGKRVGVQQENGLYAPDKRPDDATSVEVEQNDLGPVNGEGQVEKREGVECRG